MTKRKLVISNAGGPESEMGRYRFNITLDLVLVFASFSSIKIFLLQSWRGLMADSVFLLVRSLSNFSFVWTFFWCMFYCYHLSPNSFLYCSCVVGYFES